MIPEGTPAQLALTTALATASFVNPEETVRHAFLPFALAIAMRLRARAPPRVATKQFRGEGDVEAGVGAIPCAVNATEQNISNRGTKLGWERHPCEKKLR